ncbi:MAG: CPBP family intramembrane metalloprotease [Desulfitobacteriaceae bacterium]|nr:CPBP family intramembrane metalloprotease [Desulfitobacteriaceae bacterium]MDD4346099.1 CPBP family intramembrane metalloprotease [Desulfitobacteriaceae bacterium]MDD4400886.1 CPBP family intramembrane metalloprotease [Desulfitobacteriaceae bacterium]
MEYNNEAKMEDQQPETRLTQTKPVLNWVDLGLTVGGIVLLYILLIIGTVMLAGIIHTEKTLVYINGFCTQAAFILLILGLKIIRKWSWQDLGWRSVSFKKIWAQILRLYFLTLGINYAYAFYLLQRGFTPPSTDVYTVLFENAGLLGFILNLILAVIIAPVAEETLFRGLIYGSSRTYFGKWTAAAISSALFSALHFQLYGFFPRFILGLVLAYLYERNQSLLPAMVFHALNNSIAVTLLAGIAG